VVKYTGARPATIPVWEERWPGRLQFELDRLAEHATGDLTIDDDRLAKGELHLSFTWPLASGEHVELEATYPSSFPRLRPHIRLKADPDTFPDRHVGPNGELCLLGRDSRLWQAKYTLAGLLQTNLESALTNSGAEDPQGEPIEVWWNAAGRADQPNFLLVDSAWNLSGHDGGVAEIVYRFELLKGRPRFQAAVNKVCGEDPRHPLAERAFAIPGDLASKGRPAQITWKRDDDLPLPHQGHLAALLDRLDHRGRYDRHPEGTVRVSLTAQRTELQHEKVGDGYVCAVAVTRGTGKNAKTYRFHVPVYRAGETDIGHRVPAVASFRKSRVLLVGAGALGSPLAVELARNGITHLSIVDHDVVEPGNSIRWVLGASTWGKRKPIAVADHISSEYPWTRVGPVDANIGLGAPGADEAELLARLIEEADVVVDASASTGVTNYLSDECRRLGKTLVSVAATASLKGGTVSIYRPSSGCPICREHAYYHGQFARAPGATDYSELTQPPGCAESTFTGASFDLQELTLQAVRAIAGIIEGSDIEPQSVVQTLSLHDGARRTLPSWIETSLPPSPKCRCAR
jgi:hypothetical protein